MTVRFGLGVLTVLVVGATVIPMLAPPSLTDIGDVVSTRLLPPLSRDVHGQWHLLGTDAFGRDLAIRLWTGARISLVVGIVGTLLSGALGIVLGAIAGWMGGVMDRVISALSDTLLAVPRLVLLLVIAALWGPGLMTVILVLGSTGWMAIMRLVRAEVLLVRQLPYIESAHALGVPSWRTLWHHALPNAMGSAVVGMTLGVGNAMLLESGLSFLGLGVQPPAASWGNMIAGGREWLLVAPWIALVPGGALLLAVFAATLVGDGLGARPSNAQGHDSAR